MRPKVKHSKLPDEQIFGERKVTEIKLPDGDLMIVKRSAAANWVPEGKEFGVSFFGPKGGCKWELNLTKTELETIWEEIGLAIPTLKLVLSLPGMPEREERALKALNAYPNKEAPNGYIEWETAIIDLMADLLHFAKGKKIDPAMVLRCAASHFEEEKKS